MACIILFSGAAFPAFAQYEDTNDKLFTIPRHEPLGVENGCVLSNVRISGDVGSLSSGLSSYQARASIELVNAVVEGYKYDGTIYTHYTMVSYNSNTGEERSRTIPISDINQCRLLVSGQIALDGANFASFEGKSVLSQVSTTLVWFDEVSSKITPWRYTVSDIYITSTAHSYTENRIKSMLKYEQRKKEEAKNKAEEDEEKSEGNIWTDVQNENSTGNIWNSVDKTQNNKDSDDGNPWNDLKSKNENSGRKSDKIWDDLSTSGKGKEWGGIGNLVESEITSKDGKQGVIDQNGNVLIPFKNWRILGYKNGIAKVQFDEEDKELTTCSAYTPGPGYDYSVKLNLSTYKIAYVQADGKYLMPPQKTAYIYVTDMTTYMAFLTSGYDSAKEAKKAINEGASKKRAYVKRKCSYLNERANRLKLVYISKGYKVELNL
jgi:hypothetical protein